MFKGLYDYKLHTSKVEYRPPVLGLVAEGKCLRIGSKSVIEMRWLVSKSAMIIMDCPQMNMLEADDPSGLAYRYCDPLFDFSSRIASNGT